MHRLLLKVVAAKPTKPAACMTTPDNPAPLCTRERLLYSTFNGADYLIKSIIGKYMFFSIRQPLPLIHSGSLLATAA
jgi:hypothetical protein